MRTQSFLVVLLSFVFAFVFSISWANDSLVDHHTCEEFVQCLGNHSNSISKVIYTPENSSYASILSLGIQNLRSHRLTPLNLYSLLCPRMNPKFKPSFLVLKSMVWIWGFEGLATISRVFLMYHKCRLWLWIWLIFDPLVSTLKVVMHGFKVERVLVSCTIVLLRIAEKSRTLGFPGRCLVHRGCWWTHKWWRVWHDETELWACC